MHVNDIIQGCLAGDTSCQKQLFDRLSGKMMGVCMRYSRDKMEAEDLLQECFIKVYLNLATYKNDGPFELWVRRIIINTSIKRYHKMSYQNESPSSDFLPERQTSASAHDGILYEELLGLVNELPDGYRVVFNLYAIEGFSHKEIGELLNIKEATSRSQLVKARMVLQEKITKSQKIVI
ncbi:MAG: RNA polymerase sigma factor [Saprospiraceae bacterium]|nr:RNA polymerase sigma factor [Saprospiraceae bacterium]